MATTFTILFTDIEGSSRLWETERTRMAGALALHDELCSAAVAANGGQLVTMTGDGHGWQGEKLTKTIEQSVRFFEAKLRK